MEELKGVTYDFDGVELKEWQAIQRLLLAGFHDPRVLMDMFAIIEGESGSYTKAWHANVRRDGDDRHIFYRDDGMMLVKSVDLGFIQRNVVLAGEGTWIEPTTDTMGVFVETLFSENPELATADTSAAIAYDLWRQRGFTPWYAYQPGTERYKLKKRRAAKAIANYLLRTQVGRMEIDGGKFPLVDFVDQA